MVPGEIGDRKPPAKPFFLNVEQTLPQSLVHLQPSKQLKKTQFKAASGEKLNGRTRLVYEEETLMECGGSMSNNTTSTKNCEYTHDDPHVEPAGAVGLTHDDPHVEPAGAVGLTHDDPHVEPAGAVGLTHDDPHVEPAGAVGLNKKVEDFNDGQGVSQNSWSENVNNMSRNDEDEGSTVTTSLNETFKTDQIPGASEPADLTASPDTTWYGTLSFSPSDVGNSEVTEAVDCSMNRELVCPAMKLCDGEGEMVVSPVRSFSDGEGEMVVSPLCSCGGGLENLSW